MASQHGLRFVAPVLNQNFSSNTCNVNPSMNNLQRSQFQEPPVPTSGSFPSHERFIPGFQNRPQFSNYPNAAAFVSNQPPPTAHPPPPVPTCSPFSGLSNPSSRPPFTSHPPPSRPSFASQPSTPSQPPFPPQPPALSHPPFPSQPPAPAQHFPSQSSVPPNPPFSSQPSVSSLPHFSTCHPPPISHQSPVPSHPPPPLSQPPFSSQRPFLSHEPPSQHIKFSNKPNPPQYNEFSSMPNPQYKDFSNIPNPNISNPPQINFRNMPNPPQQSRFPNMSHPPQQNRFPRMFHQQHQEFRSKSPSYSPDARNDNSFQRSYRPWNQMTRFSRPKTPFSNQSPNVVKTHQFKDTSQPQQINKEKKQKNREFRKIKEDFTEKPFSCDTCDRAFATENELKDHISQHIRCDYKNCTFEAHHKIVLLHQKMQHETGYAERINKLQDAAEVKKWREERRKRFPTAENIRKRQAEQAEREARGEVLETKEFGKFKRRREENSDIANNRGKRMRFHPNRRNNFRRHFNRHHPDFQKFKDNSESDSDSDSHISLNGFSGLSSLANSAEEMCHAHEASSSEQNLSKSNSKNDENHLIISHSENNSTDQKSHSPNLSKAEEPKDNARPANESVLEIPENEIEKPAKELIDIEDSDDEGPEVLAIVKHQDKINVDERKECNGNDAAYVSKKNLEETNKGVESNSNDEANVSKKNLDETTKESMIKSDVNEAKVSENNHEEVTEGNKSRWQRPRKDSKFNGLSAEQDGTNQVRKSSLLEKLLADEIRHERNVILQCIRHIVNNNFFGLAVKKS